MWLPQWLEERSEVSEKAKKLYAYLTYFAGGKGYAWPSFNILAEKLHCSRRHVVRLVQELSAHRLITVINVSNPGSAALCKLLPLPLASLDADQRDATSFWRRQKANPSMLWRNQHRTISNRRPLVTSGHSPGDIPITNP